METQKCSKCKVICLLTDFGIKKLDIPYKTCISCRERGKQNNKKYVYKCIHNKRPSICKDCGGSQICEHNKIRSVCKDCNGGSICSHNKRRVICVECSGGSICEHNRIKSVCKDCGGSQICEHNKVRSVCKDCNGGSICEHNKRRVICVECNGSQICEHNRIKSVCKDCGGSRICEHNKQKNLCDICDPTGHLSHTVRNTVCRILKNNKNQKSIEYLDCSIEKFRIHIEDQFEDKMSWENYGEWQIDHIIPLKYDNPSLEEVIERLNYTNTQPLWKHDNLVKGNRYIG